MAKPILVVRSPYGYIDGRNVIAEVLNKECPDYNIICVFEKEIESVSFEVFNVQDYEPIDFEQLKAKLEAI